MRVRVTETLGDLERDCRAVAARPKADLPRVVARNAKRGNEIARTFASQQHTMNSDVDLPYSESFSAEEINPLAWAYGPVDNGVKHGGGQARGYEYGSRNQKPHLDLARSRDIIGPDFADDVADTAAGWFW